MKTIIWKLLLSLTLFACNNQKPNMDNFTSRIHTIDLKTDLFNPLGPTTLDKHLIDFNNINWKTEYWKEDKSETYNATDLEVLDVENSKYLSVSVCPNTHDSFQFYVGLGSHNKNPENGQITRKVRLYGTATDDPEKTKEIIRLFFFRDFENLNRQLKKMDFFEELDDGYQNIKDE